MEYLINIYEYNECWMTVVFVPSLMSNFLENGEAKLCIFLAMHILPILCAQIEQEENRSRTHLTFIRIKYHGK